jgi:hypothetical protein
MSPIVEKPHRVIRVTRRYSGEPWLGNNREFSIELISETHPTDTVQVHVTAEEFASLAGCYESMKYQRDMRQIERDPNLYGGDV